MNFVGLFAVLALAWTARSQEPVECALPLVGTDTAPEFSAGNVYPAICWPWGMNTWTPQTGKMGDGWVYTYAERKINGFKQTHQPSPWINDYGQFAVMALTGKPVFTERERASWFSHKAETAQPNYYSVYLADYDTTVEITPTERAAMFRITYPETDSPYFVVDAYDRSSFVKILPNERRIVGWSTRNTWSCPGNFKNYFVMQFDTPFAETKIWEGEKILDGISELEGKHVGAMIKFAPTRRGQQVQIKIASSFISPGQAALNLKELGSMGFDEVRGAGRDRWNSVLGRIRLEDATPDQRRMFYTSLYRAMLFPRKIHEIDVEGKIVHYSPNNGKVLPGFYYTDTGFLDTFRALFPLLNFICQDENSEMTAGLKNCYRECGWLPEWASPVPRGCMIGQNSVSVVADAWLSGSREGYDINKLFEACVSGANDANPFIGSGRPGHQYYNELGYVPRDVKITDSAARTLEYAYNDWCIWKLAVALGRPKEEIDRYAARCQNYRNVFDPARGWMVGRNRDGTFNEKFNPYKWGGDFIEGNSLHYTWSVIHDVRGLIELMGGERKFIDKLDRFFALPPTFDASAYMSVIHEIREMQTQNFGQYAHGNEPIQHMIYLYNYAGEPWKTQYWVREALNRLYRPTVDGMCGDDDNGQTSAWYVWSSLGFYPVCPGSNQYVIGAPLFKKAVVKLRGGKELVISADKNSDSNRYIQSVKLNGKKYGKNFFDADTLRNGGSIEFVMGDKPNRKRGTGLDARPYSYSDQH